MYRAILAVAPTVLIAVVASDKELKQPPHTFVNRLGMTLVWIPQGCFDMGSSPEDPEGYPKEIQHRVTLTKGFYLGTCLVTQEQWAKVMGYNPSEFKAGKLDIENATWDDLVEWVHLVITQPNLPVENVTWDECHEFLKRLSKRDGVVYRLPTEAEWEYACRAGTTTRYSFGDHAILLGQYAWYDKNSNWKTHPVGLKKPNRWGLYDMHGNVWQWCSDWYGPYSKEAVTDPIGPPSGDGYQEKERNWRVIRGGSFFDNENTARCAFHDGDDPKKTGDHIGFRVVRER
jgi:formylglycine-generating enzyme required for sulfatase activity